MAQTGTPPPQQACPALDTQLQDTPPHGGKRFVHHHKSLTKTLTEKEIIDNTRDRHAVPPLVKTSQAEPAYGLGLPRATSQAAESLQEPALTETS